MWIYLSVFFAGFLGLFGHWLTRYQQERTSSSFKEYMVGDWPSSMQSIMANLSSSIGIVVSIPEDIHGKALMFVIFTAYTAGYMFDSTLNKDTKYATLEPKPTSIRVQRSTKNEPINDVLSDDADL